MRAVSMMVACSLLFAGCAKMQMPMPASPQWVDFYSAPSRHAASFPERPKPSLKETVVPGGSKAYTYLQEVQAGDKYFGTGWIQIAHAPTDKGGRDRVLDAAVAAAVQSSQGGVLLLVHSPEIGGSVGRMYTIDVPAQKMRLRQQIFVAGDGVVEQTYSGPAGSETDADAERFFASLRLLP